MSLNTTCCNKIAQSLDNLLLLLIITLTKCVELATELNDVLFNRQTHDAVEIKTLMRLLELILCFTCHIFLPYFF